MRAPSTLLLILALSLGGLLRAGEGVPSPLLGDRDLFPEELFPGVRNLDENELMLEALVSRFPSRLLRQPPLIPTEADGEPIVRPDDAGIAYVRVRRLSLAFPSIEAALERPVALLDLRYVYGNLEDAVRLGSLIIRNDELTLQLIGDYPADINFDGGERITIARGPSPGPSATVIVLVNGDTSGPLEAVLAELQAHRQIITVGTPTAGATATYQPIPGYSGWHIIRGEIRPAVAGTLVGTGLDPSILIDEAVDLEAAAFAGFDPEQPLNTILDNAVEKDRFDEARLMRNFTHTPEPRAPTEESDQAGSDADAAGEESPPEPLPIDQTLRRALYVIEAMRALGRIP